MNRRVLLICYYFPPLGMGGIGRPLNLFQEMPGVGWDCDVLTVKPVAYRGYERDLADQLDSNRIYRSGSYDPQRVLYLLGVRKVAAGAIASVRAASSRYFPDSKVGWVGPAVRRGKRLCKANNYDVVMSTSPPVSTHMVARQLSIQYDIPWVADFRDYWSVTPVERTYDRQSQIDRGNEMLDDIRRNAVRITAVNKSVADYVGNGIVIRNAFNEGFAQAWQPPSDSSTFRLGMLGHGVDRESWLWLVDVLLNIGSVNPGMISRIEIVQVGQSDAAQMQADLDERSLRCTLRSHGHLSRHYTINTLNSTHAVYLGMSQPEGLQFVPGRVYDLLASGRPIISNAHPQSEIASIITGTGNGWCYSPGDSKLAASRLSELADRATSDRLQIVPRPDYARLYSSRAQAEAFAKLFAELL
jgi:glycosyltransferase involved in cell wall biosynthesis